MCRGVNKNYNREIRRGGQKMGVVTKRKSEFFFVFFFIIREEGQYGQRVQ